MGLPYLFHFLQDGRMKDNRRYKVASGELTGDGIREAIALKNKSSFDAGTWSFLHDTAEFGTGDKAGDVVLFNERDYHHNTSDPLFTLIGSSVQDFSLTTGNLIGWVKRDGYSLKISSRFGDAFLKYIISDADGFMEVKDSGGQGSGDHHWLLVYLWQVKLKRAYRLGLPKSYVTRSEVIPCARGRIHPVDYHIHSERPAYKCTYREHSYCNDATILIAETLRRLKSHSFLRGMEGTAAAFAVAAEGKRRGLADLLRTQPFTNPFYADYNALIDLSKKILTGGSAGFGTESDTSAFLFDVSMLFEYFIRKLIMRAGGLLEPKVDPALAIPTAGLWKKSRRLEPDLLFSMDGKTHLFDVKYKSFDFNEGVKREDLFQLHTYLGQCSNRREIGTCGFIYPVSSEKWITHQLDEIGGVLENSIRFGGRDIPFKVLFVEVPPEGEEFNREFQRCCGRFVEKIRERVIY